MFLYHAEYPLYFGPLPHGLTTRLLVNLSSQQGSVYFARF